MRPLPIIASSILGACVAAFVLLRTGAAPWIGPAAGIASALLVWWIWTRRERRRRKLASAPFPEKWRQELADHVEYYARLSDAEKRRFEGEVRIFIDEHPISGPRGASVDEELKVLVAASAVALIFGRPGFRYPRLRDIVVYDRSFDEQYGAGGNILGMVHAQGPILFSAASLRRGFQSDEDGQNVGYHEFAHVLDFEGGSADGIAGGFMPWKAVKPWLTLMHEETARVKRKKSLLRQYAATNEAEFFAVATEMFFERPKKLKEKHPELYELLRETYGQDPSN
jgi:Mlc titration factor MtfA (ptsG expression regulator)